MEDLNELFVQPNIKGRVWIAPWWGWRLQKQVVNSMLTEEIPWNQENLKHLGWDIKLAKSPGWGDWGSSASLGFDLPWANGCCYSITQSCPTLRPHGLQHARLLCPSLFPGVDGRDPRMLSRLDSDIHDQVWALTEVLKDACKAFRGRKWQD